MRAGAMDRYITIQKNTVTTDAYGASINTWSTRVQVWAERRELAMAERIQAQAVKSDLSAKYYVRYNTAILVKDRIVDGSDTYEVTGIVEIGRKQGHILLAGTI
jgi:SPP1 family predicted phage head-tail adaptor